MSSYQIVDEPRARTSDRLIVDPVIILLVALLLPLFWTPPFMGRIWLPFAWILINGYLLGSPSWPREILLSLVGVCGALAIVVAHAALSGIEPYSQFESLAQYSRIFLNAFFLLMLYLVVLKQSVPYQIFSYMQER